MHAHRTVSLAGFVVTLLAGPAATGAPADRDWPQFRGPDGQGHAVGDSWPLRWSENENVVWKVAG